MRLDKPREVNSGTVRCPPPCGKVRYNSRQEAKRLGRRFYSAGARLRAYQCESSDFWHLTSADAVQTAWLRGVSR